MITLDGTYEKIHEENYTRFHKLNTVYEHFVYFGFVNMQQDITKPRNQDNGVIIQRNLYSNKLMNTLMKIIV